MTTMLATLFLLTVVPSTEEIEAPPAGEVTIYRDTWGVPHLYASREQDAFYGLGYAQAEDQLDVIAQSIFMGRGELASIVGTEGVASDGTSRQWRHVEEAQRGFEQLDPKLQACYRGYAAGLNRFLEEHPERAPRPGIRFEPWDPVVLSRSLLWTSYMAGDGLGDCQRGGVRLSAADREAVLERSRLASNEWVLAPWRTADDAMIVLSDPHGGIDGSFVYESRIHAGDLHCCGFSLGGLLLLNHNRDVSWGMTTGAPDVSDCYVVQVDPNNPRRYQFDGEWKEMEVHEVEIEVRDSSPVTRTFEYTHHNDILCPVVARQGNRAYVVCTAYMHGAGDLDQEVFDLNHATGVSDVYDAMERLGMFAQNLMFGDSSGESLYIRAGRSPRRPDGFDWTKPVPGNDSRSAWDGVHPLDELVQIDTPDTGYMQNNNISPDRMAHIPLVDANDYPDYLFNDTPGRTNSRALRNIEALSTAVGFTVEDAIELALDEKWVGTEIVQRLLRRLARESEVVRGLTTHERQILRTLDRFDGHARAESAAALQFWAWREFVGSKVSFARFVELDRSPEPLPDAMMQTMVEGVQRVAAQAQEWPRGLDTAYGDLFRIGRGDVHYPLGGGWIGPGRGQHPLDFTATLRAFGFGPPDDRGIRLVQSGSRLLRLAIFTEPIQSFTLHNFGQSEDPSSPHYLDQARLSSERRVKPTWFEPESLAGHVRSKKTLKTGL